MSAIRPPVPSRTLLRFLRSQSDNAFPVSPVLGSTTGRCKHSRNITTSARASPLAATTTRTCLPTTACSTSRIYTPQTANAAYFSTSKLAGNKWVQDRCKEPPQPPPSWQERLWGIAARRGDKPLKPEDLPGQEDFEHGSSMFTARRIMTAKAAAEPRLRCTEVDENGEVILVDGEFKKTELIAKV